MADKEVKVHVNTTSNPKGVKDVNVELDKLDQEASATEKAAKDLRKETDKLDDSSKDLAKSLDKEADKLDEVAKKARTTSKVYKTQRKVTGEVSKQTGKMTKGNSKAALGFLEVSRAVEDAQYGLRGVLNNIPQIITLFGGGAGLAGVVSIAAVAFAQLSGRMSYAKKNVEDLGTELDGVVDDHFSQFSAALEDEEYHKAFRKYLADDGIALDSFSSKLAIAIAKKREMRSLEIELREKEIGLEIAKIEAGDGSHVEKQKKISPLRQELALLKGEDKRATLKEELSIFQQKQEEALSAIASTGVQMQNLMSELVSSTDILNAEGKAKDLREERSELASSALSKKVVEGSTDALRTGKGLATDYFDPQTKERSQKNIAQYQELIELFKSSPDAQEKALHELVKLGEKISNSDERYKKSGKRVPFSQVDFDIIKASRQASGVLQLLEEEEAAKQEAEKLKVRRESQQKQIGDLSQKRDLAKGDLPKLAAELEKLKLRLSYHDKFSSVDTEVRSQKSEADLDKARKKDVTEKQRKEAEEKRKAKGVETDDQKVLKLGGRALKLAEAIGAPTAGIAQLEAAIASLEDGQTGAERAALESLVQKLGGYFERQKNHDKATAIRIRSLEKQLEGFISGRK